MKKLKLFGTTAAIALAASGALAQDVDLIGSRIAADFNAAGWSNTASLGITSQPGSGAQAASVSVSSNLDFNIFGIGLGSQSGWSYDAAENDSALSADVTMTYAHDRDIDVSMLQDGAGETTVSAQSLGVLDVTEVSASGIMMVDGEFVTANAGGHLGGTIPNEDETPIASMSSYVASIESSDDDFVAGIEQDNYALTLAVVNAHASSDGLSTELDGGDISIGDTLGVSAIGNVALDVGNRYADYRDMVLGYEGFVPSVDPNDPSNIGALVGPGLYMLNPVGLILTQALDDTDDNFVVVTQLGGDANLSAVVADGVGEVMQNVGNTTIMSGGIFAGITSTVSPVVEPEPAPTNDNNNPPN